MSSQSQGTMSVVSLPNGLFAVRIGNRLEASQQEFASVAEAEAWILQQAMIDDENAFDTGILRPGPGQNVA